MSKYRIILEGKAYEMEVNLVDENTAFQSVVQEERKEFETETKDSTVRYVDSPNKKMISDDTGVVVSPMPGTVIKTNKGEGEIVKSGEVVLILEAMKMENEIPAPVDGTIVKLNCTSGKSVDGGEVLFEIR